MDDLGLVAEKWGIQPGYHDVFGHWHAVYPQTVSRLVAALSEGGGNSQAAVIAASHDNAPVRAFQGDGRRVWGLAVQLYALRSRSNWGLGDFGDLKRLIGVAAAAGAAAVGLNPLHALFPDRADQASPYAPNSRLFLNVLYIDVAAIPEFPGTEAAGLADDIAAARNAELIDYPAVARAKLAGLRAAYGGFRANAKTARRADFETYRKEQGDALLRFACFEVLRMKHAPAPWPQWPAPWRQPDSATLLEFRRANLAECEFQEFMQWVASRQLQACKDQSHSLGMSIGLYTDLAVGIDPNGADAWSRQDAILAGFSIGAPPDEFNPAGQDWGLAPFNPRTFAANDFEPLRMLMRGIDEPCRRGAHRSCARPQPDVSDSARQPGRRTAPMCTIRSKRCCASSPRRAIARAASSSARISAPCLTAFVISLRAGACGPIAS